MEGHNPLGRHVEDRAFDCARQKERPDELQTTRHNEPGRVYAPRAVYRIEAVNDRFVAYASPSMQQQNITRARKALKQEIEAF